MIKKLIVGISVCLTLSCGKSFAQAAIVNDPMVLAEVIGLGSQAVQQITTLSEMLRISKDVAKKLSQVTTTITLVSDVDYIIKLGISSVNDANRLMSFVRDQKVISLQSALYYSGECINSVNRIMANTTRLTSLVKNSLIDATVAERSNMIQTVKKEMEEEKKRIQTMNAQIARKQQYITTMQYVMQRQGIKIVIK